MANQAEPMAPIVLGVFVGTDLYCTSCGQTVREQLFDYGMEEISGKDEMFYIRPCKCGCIVKHYSWLDLGQSSKAPKERIQLGEIPLRIVRAKIAERDTYAAYDDSKDGSVESVDSESEGSKKVRRRVAKEPAKEETPSGDTEPSVEKPKPEVEVMDVPLKQRRKRRRNE